jgi:hypothetical protein
MEAVSIASLWSRGNTLRRRFRAHESAGRSADPTDPARLPPLVAEILGDLVDTYNVFMIGDPTGRDLDQVRLGPQERDFARTVVDAALPIVEAVQASDGVATTEAVGALTEQIQAACDAASSPDVNSDQAVELGRKTISNFVVELLRRSYSSILALPGMTLKDARAGIVGTAAWEALVHHQELIKIVAQNADKLKAFVDQAFQNPDLARIIDIIAQGSAFVQ